jgi:hypothetical protein
MCKKMWQLYIGSLFILCIGSINIPKIKCLDKPKPKKKIIIQDNDYGHFIYMD